MNPCKPNLPVLCRALISAGLLSLGAGGAFAAPSELFISEYVEGSSNNKAIELFNGTSAAVDLSAGQYALRMYFNGSTSAGLTILLNGVVQPGQTFVIAHGSAVAELRDKAQQLNSSSWFNGDDAIVLTKAGVVIDSIGQVGVDPGTEWGSGLTSTADNTLRRKATVHAGDTDPHDAFDPALEWDGYPVNDFSGIGIHVIDGGGSSGGGGNVGLACGQPHTAAYAVQGSGNSSPLVGQVVSTEGVVVGDYEGPSPALRGFYLQDEIGDGDPYTSDAVFVFNGNADSVNPGDRVRVTGTVAEYQGQTQISATAIEACGSGNVEPVEIVLPVATADELERYEGMLVRLPQTLYVTEHYQLGRFGQVVVSAGGRQWQPTHVVMPGEQAMALQDQNALARIIVDDGDNAQNADPIVFGREGQPLSASNTLRGGDTVTGLTGVLTWTWAGNSASGNAWRVRPVGALGGVAQFAAANPRPQFAPNVGGDLRVASLNVLNYFNTFADGNAATPGCFPSGTDADCRGAESALEFERQAAKTVATLLALDADVVGLIEIENDGYGPDSALQDLVDRLNAATAPATWALLDIDARTGQQHALGTDAIKVAFIYRPASVVPVGRSAVLNDPAFVTGGDTAARNRPALAQAFEAANGGRFIAVVNHLKSKGSACEDADALDGQGNCNVVRLNAVNVLRSWLAQDPTGTGDPDVLIIGDLNAYGMEDPVRALTDNGYVDVVRRFAGEYSYTYVFNGQWGSLDHALASASLVAQVSDAQPWHVSADEPSVLDYNVNFKSAAQIQSLYAADVYRNSDHDPILIGLSLDAPTVIEGTQGADVLTGSARDEVFIGRGGRDVLTGGGGGRNQFVYENVLDGGDVITDFRPGRDLLVLRDLLVSLGIDGTQALAKGQVVCSAASGGAVIGIDTDGSAGPLRSRAIVQLRGVGCGELSAGDYRL